MLVKRRKTNIDLFPNARQNLVPLLPVPYLGRLEASEVQNTEQKRTLFRLAGLQPLDLSCLTYDHTLE